MEIGPIVIVSARGADGRDRPGLYLILVKAYDAKIGPYFASLTKAHDAARKIIKRYPAAIWKQPFEWLSRQKEMLTWIHNEIGAWEDLVDGYWVDDEGKIILSAGKKC